MHRTLIVILLAGVAGMWLLPHPAHAQVRRCNAADGTTVYTDRQCRDIGASERLLPAPSPGSGGSRFYRACAGSVQDLAYSLGEAIQSGDVNQLAGLYDFSGASTRSGYQLMRRLGGIARRPLVDVQPVYSGGTDPYAEAYAGIDQFDQDGQAIQPPMARPRLLGLRVEQTLANGSTPSRTVFGLRKQLGCWWLHF